MRIFADVNINVMKHQKTIVTILLNILFCVALLRFYSRNAYLRPYAGSTLKETLTGLLLLASLYANYYLLYPLLVERRHSRTLYWLALVVIVLVFAVLELAIAYPSIMNCNGFAMEQVGFYSFFSTLLFVVCGRNLFFNFFPYLFRERKRLQEHLDTEVRFVYQNARMLDVCDDQNNCQHIPVDNILYCKKYGNETEIHTVDGMKYTRYCTIKYLEQHFGNKEFTRISSSVIVPFQHIASCDGKAVTMQSMLSTEAPLTFKLDSKRASQIAAAIDEYLRGDIEEKDGMQRESEEEKGKKGTSVPPKEKLDTVFHYIQEHPGCRSTELISHTSYSQTTMDRCLFELKKQGLIEYTGSKKSGGYYPINTAVS